MDWIQTALEEETPVGILLHWSKEDTLEAYTMVETDRRESVEIFKIQKKQDK